MPSELMRNYCLELDKGEILLRDCRCLHAGTPNDESKARILPGFKIVSPLWHDTLYVRRPADEDEKAFVAFIKGLEDANVSISSRLPMPACMGLLNSPRLDMHPNALCGASTAATVFEDVCLLLHSAACSFLIGALVLCFFLAFDVCIFLHLSRNKSKENCRNKNYKNWPYRCIVRM